MNCHPERRSEPRQRGEDKSRDLVLPAGSANAVLAKYVLLAAAILLTTYARSDCIAVPEAKNI
jgi:hypothetical protein